MLIVVIFLILVGITYIQRARKAAEDEPGPQTEAAYQDDYYSMRVEKMFNLMTEAGLIFPGRNNVNVDPDFWEAQNFQQKKRLCSLLAKQQLAFGNGEYANLVDMYSSKRFASCDRKEFKLYKN